MAFLVLPAGQSLRSVAHRLGVSVEELQKHAGVKDAEAPLPADQRVQVPDGFLRSRATARQLKDAVVTESGRKGGMNTFLALDIEQKRTRASGGMKAHGASEFELEALEEAWRTYCRFDADSNELAIEMYDRITVTQSIEVRGQAFAGQACALAQRARLFGEPIEKSRPQALSAAKAALLANPKLGDAHLGMALAIGCVDEAPAIEEARAELETALEQDPRAGRCWAEMAALIERQGVFSEAEAAIAVALELEPEWLFTLCTAASLAVRRGDTERGVELLTAASERYPHHANVITDLALLLRASGQESHAMEIQDRALSLATRDSQKLALNTRFSSGSFPT
jgi:Flp pilus assembly protein TadD